MLVSMPFELVVHESGDALTLGREVVALDREPPVRPGCETSAHSSTRFATLLRSSDTRPTVTPERNHGRLNTAGQSSDPWRSSLGRSTCVLVGAWRFLRSQSSIPVPTELLLQAVGAIRELWRVLDPSPTRSNFHLPAHHRPPDL